MPAEYLIVLVNVGYLLSLVAFLVRDVLLLRALLLVAQLLNSFYMFSVGVFVSARWNLVFAAINVVWIAKILSDRRRVTIPAELRPLYDRHFAALPPRDFLKWWALGTRQQVTARLTADGRTPEALFFIVNGSVRVTRRDHAVTELPQGHFVGEMSLITGAPANANVDPLGPVDVQQWQRKDLDRIKQHEPALWVKVQSAIGLDLVQKIRRLDDGLVAS